MPVSRTETATLALAPDREPDLPARSVYFAALFRRLAIDLGQADESPVQR